MRVVGAGTGDDVAANALQNAGDDASMAQRFVGAEAYQADGLAGFVFAPKLVELCNGAFILGNLPQK